MRVGYPLLIELPTRSSDPAPPSRKEARSNTASRRNFLRTCQQGKITQRRVGERKGGEPNAPGLMITTPTGHAPRAPQQASQQQSEISSNWTLSTNHSLDHLKRGRQTTRGKEKGRGGPQKAHRLHACAPRHTREGSRGDLPRAQLSFAIRPYFP